MADENQDGPAAVDAEVEAVGMKDRALGMKDTITGVSYTSVLHQDMSVTFEAMAHVGPVLFTLVSIDLI